MASILPPGIAIRLWPAAYFASRHQTPCREYRDGMLRYERHWTRNGKALGIHFTSSECDDYEVKHGQAEASAGDEPNFFDAQSMFLGGQRNQRF